MPIHDDLSDLPPEAARVGMFPVEHPVVVPLLAEAWYESYLEGDEHVPSAKWWASLSSMCARAVGYEVREGEAKRALAIARREMAELSTETEPALLADVERIIGTIEAQVESLAPTNPPSIADAWRFGIGSMIHDQLQKVLPTVFPDAQIELRVTIEDWGSARIDAVITEQRDEAPFVTVLELKSVNGFGYKTMATSFKGAPEGPRKSAIVQGAMAAKELNADRLIIGLLSLECLSPDVAQRNGLDEIGRFAAEWHFTPAEYLPYAEQETKRVRKILDLVEAGTLPPRSTPEIPPRARIVDPRTGAWTITDEAGQIQGNGKTWVCGYCRNRDRCLADGAS